MTRPVLYPGGLVGSPLPVCPSARVERGSDRPPRTRIEGHSQPFRSHLHRVGDGAAEPRTRQRPLHSDKSNAVGTDKEESYMHHFTAIDALPAVRPQESTPEPGTRISVFASEGKLRPHVLQITGTAAELLAFAEGIRNAVWLLEMRQLAATMDPLPGTAAS